jgi:hypothetical protein
MNRRSIGCAIAAMLALAASISAQNPPPNPQSQPQTPASAAPSEGAVVTVEGCLVREQDVPGRRPNIVERQGVMQDYILTSTKIVKGSAAASGTAEARPGQPAGVAGAVGTAGSSAMYHVKGISNEKLTELVGRRVQVDGKLQDLDRAAPRTSEDLPDIQATAIRQVTGECPAKP